MRPVTLRLAVSSLLTSALVVSVVGTAGADSTGTSAAGAPMPSSVVVGRRAYATTASPSSTIVVPTTVALALPAGGTSTSTTSTTVGPSATTTTTATAPAGAAGSGTMAPASAPLSLTALMAKYSAEGKGIDLSAYLRDRGAELDAELGTGKVFGSSAFSSLGSDAETFEALNRQLVTEAFGQPGSTDLDQLAGRLAASASTPDGRAVAKGIDMGRTAGKLPSPTLPALQMPRLAGASSILSAGPDELAFGLFANQAIAQTVRSSPNLVAQVRSGQLSPASQAQFQAGMNSAAANFSRGLGSALPSPCYAGMMLGVATGSGAGASALNLPRSCAPCITAGTYMHSRMGDLLTPGQFSANTSDGRITQYEWANMDPATKKAIMQMNPDLARRLQSGNQRAAATGASKVASTNACQQASAGTTNYLSTNMGSLLGRIGV